MSFLKLAGFITLALTLAQFCAPALAEACTTKNINGEQVTICCDGNGVCYRK